MNSIRIPLSETEVTIRPASCSLGLAGDMEGSPTGGSGKINLPRHLAASLVELLDAGAELVLQEVASSDDGTSAAPPKADGPSSGDVFDPLIALETVLQRRNVELGRETKRGDEYLARVTRWEHAAYRLRDVLCWDFADGAPAEPTDEYLAAYEEFVALLPNSQQGTPVVAPGKLVVSEESAQTDGPTGAPAPLDHGDGSVSGIAAEGGPPTPAAIANRWWRFSKGPVVVFHLLEHVGAAQAECGQDISRFAGSDCEPPLLTDDRVCHDCIDIALVRAAQVVDATAGAPPADDEGKNPRCSGTNKAARIRCESAGIVRRGPDWFCGRHDPLKPKRARAAAQPSLPGSEAANG